MPAPTGTTTPEVDAAIRAATPSTRRRSVTAWGIPPLLTLVVAVLAAVHLTQGSSSVGVVDVARWVIGNGDELTGQVLAAARVPRLVGGLLTGVCLGVAGAIFQSLARNPLAAPDTLGVQAGAQVAVGAVAAFGIALPLFAKGFVAFAGGLLAAAVVLGLARGGVGGTTGLVLAGSAIALALSAIYALLLILFQQETAGLFLWGSGTLSLVDLDSSLRMAPIVAAGIAAAFALARRLDVLGLGDDSAAAMGVPVGPTRVAVTVTAVLLTAASVTVAGPVGFVGLCAPVLVRLVGARVPGLLRHHLLIPAAGIAGAGITVGADVLLRAVLDAQQAVTVPTGAVTTLLGAVVLIALARTARDSAAVGTRTGVTGRVVGDRRFRITLVAGVGALAAVAVGGLLVGDRVVLLGDLVNWMNGHTGLALTYVLDSRLPRVLAALGSGGALALAGCLVQALLRNPLAEPGLLGVSGGAGFAAVLTLSVVPALAAWQLSAATAAGAIGTFGVTMAAASRGGLHADRLILVGIGVSAACSAATTITIAATDPWNTAKAMTWLSGSTYGRTLDLVVPVGVVLLLGLPLVLLRHRELDLAALDEDTPRVVGVRLRRIRVLGLGAAALLVAGGVVAAGVIGFVGLLAPHCARALVGGRNVRAVPMAVLIGAALVGLADLLGRWVIAPAQIPAGVATALLGAPYFVWLLLRLRASGGPSPH